MFKIIFSFGCLAYAAEKLLAYMVETCTRRGSRCINIYKHECRHAGKDSHILCKTKLLSLFLFDEVFTSVPESHSVENLCTILT